MDANDIKRIQAAVAPLKEIMANYPRATLTIDSKGATLKIIELQETLDTSWKVARIINGTVNDA